MDTPRKTLGLKRPASPQGEEAPRKRAGARAKQAAQRQRQQAQPQRTAQTREVTPPCTVPTHAARTPVPAMAARRENPVTRPSSNARHSIFAPCPQGLEGVLCSELQTLGVENVRPARGGCMGVCDWDGVLRVNLYARLATRILVRVAHARVVTEDDILALARDTAWEQWFGPRQRLRVDTSAQRSPMHSLHYCNLRVKDGICDRLRQREGARPDIDTVRPDARVHLFLDETSATLYLDTSGESLFKRGWRLDKGAAPLRENLASGLLALAGWTPDQTLLDPYCGSGTILIEAASMAVGLPAGMTRPFGFERLRNHDAVRWQRMKEAARAQCRTQLDIPLLGADIDPALITAARANALRAGLPVDAITWQVEDARRLLPASAPGWLITNPPYGERMDAMQDTFWPAWSAHLKQHYAGWKLGVISSDMAFPGRLRFKPKRRIPVHNGALDCRLFLFDVG